MDLHNLSLGQTCLLAATAVMLWVSRGDDDRGNGLRMWRYAITSVALFFVAIRTFAGRAWSPRLLAAMVVVVMIAGAVTGEHVAWAAKFVNDTHGHAVGDAALAAFSTRLAGVPREPDRAFRYGGEEFCLLLADTEAAGARSLAERARRSCGLSRARCAR